ncbi:MAG: transketolase [Candidatus Thermoplasmatota archaeon]|nr:transketolase [Candidatus Thermoplasmatota archaeon]
MCDIELLKRKAVDIRRDIIKMIYLAGSGHLGGSLSIADIVTALYFNILNHDPSDPLWVERDRFILSKGHAVPAQYAALAETGYFSKEKLWTLRKLGSDLQGHPAMHKLAGIEASTGSLGQGISIAVGLALSLKMRKSNSMVFTIVGDGECQSGEVWEAAMAAAHYNVNNLIVIVDRNGLQIDGETEKIMSVEPLSEKWKAFGWDVTHMNGNNMEDIVKTTSNVLQNREKPSVIIAKTIKGKGISFMENNVSFHGKPPTASEYERAIKELGDIL